MKKILVLANDAGGAEVLAAMVSAERGYDWTVVTPAGSAASRTFGKTPINGRVTAVELPQISAEFIQALDFDLLLYNPGWNQFPQSVVSRLGKGKARKVAVLDHWIDYRERFGYPNQGWTEHLPDLIAVTDSSAYKLAQNVDLPALVRLKNYRVHELLSKFGKIENTLPGKREELLFLSQTVEATPHGASGNFAYIGGGEQQVLQALLDHFDVLTAHFGVNKLRIRLHPAQSERGFAAATQMNASIPVKIEAARDRDLLEGIAGAGLVIGMNSMALFTAYLCGRPAVSLISDPRIRCTLPLPAEACIAAIDQIFNIDFGKLSATRTRMDFFDDHDFGCLVRTASGGSH